LIKTIIIVTISTTRIVTVVIIVLINPVSATVTVIIRVITGLLPTQTVTRQKSYRRIIA
jgi:hypothetical protein